MATEMKFRVTDKKGVVKDFPSVQAAWKEYGNGTVMTSGHFITVRLAKLGLVLTNIADGTAPPMGAATAARFAAKTPKVKAKAVKTPKVKAAVKRLNKAVAAAEKMAEQDANMPPEIAAVMGVETLADVQAAEAITLNEQAAADATFTLVCKPESYADGALPYEPANAMPGGPALTVTSDDVAAPRTRKAKSAVKAASSKGKSRQRKPTA